VQLDHLILAVYAGAGAARQLKSRQDEAFDPSTEG
jgi:hypothetical protein